MNLNLTTLRRQAAKLLGPIIKHHAILFTLFALISIIVAIYITNSILSQPSDDAYRQAATEQSVQTRFNQETIDQINDLRAPNEGGSPALPGGRINPFTN